MHSFTTLEKVSDLYNLTYWIAETKKFRLVVQEKRVILGHSIFNIRSPFVVMNCLPKDLEMKFIVAGKEVSKESKKIPSQGSHEVYANQDILELRYKIMCEGFYWSQEFGADSYGFGQENRLYLSDR